MRVIRAGALATVLAFLTIAVLRSPAQTRSGDKNDMWVRSIENASQIVTIQNVMKRMEEAQLPERIARIEEKLSWLEWAVKALLGGVALLILERMKAVLSARKRTEEE